MAKFTQIEIEKVRDENTEWITGLEGCVGVGVGQLGSGEPCLLIMTNNMLPDTKEEVKARMADVPISFLETGEFQQQPRSSIVEFPGSQAKQPTGFTNDQIQNLYDELMRLKELVEKHEKILSQREG